MSLFVLRNNLSKIYFGSCRVLATNPKLVIGNGVNANISKGISKRPLLFPPNYVLRRFESTITPYKTSRRYILNWKLERLFGWALTILIPAAFAIDSKEIEMGLSTIALLHTYWGCQSICSDYLRSNVVGKLLPIIARLAVVFLFLTSMIGAYQLIYDDVGLIRMIKKFWAIRGRDYVPPEQ